MTVRRAATSDIIRHAPVRTRPRVRRPRDHGHDGGDRRHHRDRHRPDRDAIAADEAKLCVSEWSTLVNPGVPIPPEIQALTGITNAMVRDAPPFARVADEVAARTAGALFVAHNARFDYGFLKHAFARLQRAFSARVLCTVRLSRRLFPEEPRHNLDSVIARHGLAARRPASGARRRARPVDIHPGALSRPRSGRDRGGGKTHPQDAEPPAATRPGCARRAARGARCLSLLRPQCAAALHRQERQPAGARGRAFFVRLSLRRPICGCRPKSGASSSRKPRARSARCCAKRRSSSRCCRHTITRCAERRSRACSRCRSCPGRLRSSPPPVSSPPSSPAGSGRLRRSVMRARRCARSLPSTRSAGRSLGLEKRLGPCFARQVKRCAGACIGAESAEAHHERLGEALARARHSTLAVRRRSPRFASGRCSAIAPTCT